jgi:hypothetical protein
MRELDALPFSPCRSVETCVNVLANSSYDWETDMRISGVERNQGLTCTGACIKSSKGFFSLFAIECVT